MRIVFIGTVEFSWHCLDEMLSLVAKAETRHSTLDTRHSTVVLATYIDPAHAKSICDYRPLDDLCRAHGVPALTFRRIGDAATLAAIRAARPDVIFVLGLSQLLPRTLLDLPPAGVIGTHPALLPENRGRALIPWSILLHHERGGLSLFYLTPEVDAGDLIAQAAWPITRDDTATTLYAKMTAAGRQLIRDHLPAIAAGAAPRIPQDHAKATYLPRRTPADGLIDWSRPAEAVYDLIRATTHPYPGAFTFLGDRQVVIWRARAQGSGKDMNAEHRTPNTELRTTGADSPVSSPTSAFGVRCSVFGVHAFPSSPPGRILTAEGESVLVLCGDGGGVWLDLVDLGAGEQSPVAAGLRPGMTLGGCAAP